MEAYLLGRFEAGATNQDVISSFNMSSDFLRARLEVTGSPVDRVSELERSEISGLVQDWINHKRDQEEATALCSASVRGDVGEVKTLLGAGVPWDAEDESGVTAGEYALQSGQAQVFDELVTAGGRDIAARGALVLAAGAADGAAGGVASNVGVAAEESGVTSGAGADGDGDGDGDGGDGGGSEAGGSEHRRNRMLSGPATYDESGCLVEACGMPVMMPFETQLMEEHAQRLDGYEVKPVILLCGKRWRAIELGFDWGWLDRPYHQLTFI